MYTVEVTTLTMQRMTGFGKDVSTEKEARDLTVATAKKIWQLKGGSKSGLTWSIIPNGYKIMSGVVRYTVTYAKKK